MKDYIMKFIISIMQTVIVPMITGMVFLMAVMPAAAAGVGVQFVTGGGSFSYERADNFYSKQNNIGNTLTIGCGFVADTNLGGKSIFNYRFRIGYDFQKADNKEIETLHRLTMTHVFGAGIYTNDYLRLWIGPQVGFGYLWGSNVYHVNRYTGISSFPYDYYKDTMNFSMFNIHVGMCLGLNINVSPSVSIPVETGLRFQIYTDFKKHDEDGFEKKLFSSMGPEGYVAVGVMYRFNETPRDGQL